MTPTSPAWAPLVPELLVRDIAASLRFWRDLCGFTVRYERPEDGFAYLDRDGAQVMLEERAADSWIVGETARPFGRGINLMIYVAELTPLLTALGAAGWPLFKPVWDAWYRRDDREVGQRQVLVQDPDGYLLRFAEPLGERPLPATSGS